MNQSQDKIGQLLDYSHRVTGLNNFVLYGGTPLDLILYGTYHDIDLATKGKNEEDIVALNKRFSSSGFVVIQPRRPYYIQKGSVEVILVYAKKDDDFFDVCFINDLGLIGLFDVESSYWKYPEKEYVDRCHAFGALESKCIRPIRLLESESPLLWLSRFVRLCSKYDFSIIQSVHDQIINYLNTKLVKDDTIIQSPQYPSALSSLISSIVESKDHYFFAAQLNQSFLITTLLPELSYLLEPAMSQTLREITDKENFLSLLIEKTPKKQKANLVAKLERLKGRNWE